MRAQFEKMLAKAEDEHTKAQAVYHKALKEKANAEKKLRPACEAASKTANDVASIKAALEKMPADEAKA